MDVLLVTSTVKEIERTVASLKKHWIEQPTETFTRGSATVRFLVTGPGMIPTAYALGKTFQLSKPELCINVGIAGAYPGGFSKGEVVHVTQEVVCDFGAEDDQGALLSIEDLGISHDLNLTNLVNNTAEPYEILPKAKGLTVNKVSGINSTITQRMARYEADVETMEGAAFFYACLKARVPFLQIRSISNIIETRDREAWEMELAYERLNEQVMELLELITGG